MRQIVLDTETTGLDWRTGDRVVEIGCVEMINRCLTGRHYHVYLNPDRDISDEVVAVHGLTAEFLSDKPHFEDVAEEFENFVRDAELIIHNANFDVGFLDFELQRVGRGKLDTFCAGVIDTLRMAKEQNPGKKASLDALCDRHQIDNAHRSLHGALLDSEILAEVYLAMTRGQESLIMSLDEPGWKGDAGRPAEWLDRPALRVLKATAEERQAHQASLADIDKESKGSCIWLAATAAQTGYTSA